MAYPINVLLNLIFQPIGLIASTIVLFSIIGLYIINKESTNRMTVRLIAAIAFSDILAHIGEIYASVNRSIPLGTTHCAVVSGLRASSKTFYCFTNMAICFHLYRSLVLLKKSTWMFEFITWIVTIAMVIIFTVIYWAFGAFSGVKNKVGCNPGSDNYTLNKIFLLTMGFINLITILVGIYTTIVGHRSLSKWINTYATSRSLTGEDKELFKKERKKLAERSFLYPLSTCITLPVETAFLILYGFGSFNQKLGTPKAITLGLSGLLTGIAFAIDPATHKAFSSAWLTIRQKRLGHHHIEDNSSQKA
ncbi:hypothetical protein CONCODRAFT_3269 [Conidiobolus coronatus NRRL 28638]|uniref:G-protein coupled receptors family 1 profile domain-containing protein n=1 Tax=Conidiobolus coronatus (strain ATCC 28846 / CBS 209.66 / NRRL 28638) TaxID=796925 RepID=A0A137PFG8_CONC2|nr:hypothetical protein CONCODRAFT_3269 [Conidiobolus coronatus NRRL 28638]|eukprot:KXN73710.1 hypothetical protein CONCODRAFT_3269 [Conidiobolus coronatus NRRL 28638]